MLMEDVMAAPVHPAVAALSRLEKQSARDQPYVYHENGKRQSELYQAHVDKARSMRRRPLGSGHVANIMRDPRYQVTSEKHGPSEGRFTVGGAALGAAATTAGALALGRTPLRSIQVEALLVAPTMGALAGAAAGRALSGAPSKMRGEWATAVDRNRPGTDGRPRVPHVDPRPYLKSDKPIEREYGQYMMGEEAPVDRQHFGRAIGDDAYIHRIEEIGGVEGKNRAAMGHATAIGAAAGTYAGLAAAFKGGPAGAALGVGLPIAGMLAGHMAGKAMGQDAGSRDAELRAAIARTSKAI